MAIKVIWRMIGGKRVKLVLHPRVWGYPSRVVSRLMQGSSKVGHISAAKSIKRPHRFEMGSAYVQKEFRGMGLGKELYGSVFKDVKKLGGKFVVGESTGSLGAVMSIRSRFGKTRAIQLKRSPLLTVVTKIKTPKPMKIKKIRMRRI